MKLFNLMLAALVSGAVAVTSFAAETAPAKPTVKKKAVKKAKKAKRTLEQDLAEVTNPAPAIPKRHVKRLAEKKAYAEKHGKEVKILMLGDSITHYWERKDAKNPAKDANAVHAKYLAPYKYLNLGCGGDRTHNTLYTIEKSGILELINPKLVTIMIGTNNSGRYDYRATVAAITKIVKSVSTRYPDAVILLYAIFPRGGSNRYFKRIENEKVNAEIAKLCDGKKIIWVDINKEFLSPKGTMDKSVMYDLLHPTPKGYEIWGKSLQPYFEKYGK